MRREVLRYTADLATEHFRGKYDRILRTLGYYIDGKWYCAKKGDITDFSSTPGFYNAVISPIKLRMTGAIHDALYRKGTDCYGRIVTRKEADQVWREIAQHGDNSANWIQAWMGWAGLRLFGWVAWNRYRNNRKHA